MYKPLNKITGTKNNFLLKVLLVHRILPDPGAILEGPGAIFSSMYMYELKTLLFKKNVETVFCKMT